MAKMIELVRYPQSTASEGPLPEKYYIDPDYITAIYVPLPYFPRGWNPHINDSGTKSQEYKRDNRPPAWAEYPPELPWPPTPPKFLTVGLGWQIDDPYGTVIDTIIKPAILASNPSASIINIVGNGTTDMFTSMVQVIPKKFTDQPPKIIYVYPYDISGYHPDEPSDPRNSDPTYISYWEDIKTLKTNQDKAITTAKAAAALVTGHALIQIPTFIRPIPDDIVFTNPNYTSLYVDPATIPSLTIDSNLQAKLYPASNAPISASHLLLIDGAGAALQDTAVWAYADQVKAQAETAPRSWIQLLPSLIPPVPIDPTWPDSAPPGGIDYICLDFLYAIDLTDYKPTSLYGGTLVLKFTNGADRFVKAKTGAQQTVVLNGVRINVPNGSDLVTILTTGVLKSPSKIWIDVNSYNRRQLGKAPVDPTKHPWKIDVNKIYAASRLDESDDPTNHKYVLSVIVDGGVTILDDPDGSKLADVLLKHV